MKKTVLTNYLGSFRLQYHRLGGFGNKGPGKYSSQTTFHLTREWFYAPIAQAQINTDFGLCLDTQHPSLQKDTPCFSWEDNRYSLVIKETFFHLYLFEVHNPIFLLKYCHFYNNSRLFYNTLSTSKQQLWVYLLLFKCGINQCLFEQDLLMSVYCFQG